MGSVESGLRRRGWQRTKGARREGPGPSSRLRNPGQGTRTRSGLRLRTAEDTPSGLDSGCLAPAVRPPDTQGSPCHGQLLADGPSAAVRSTRLPAWDCQLVPFLRLLRPSSHFRALPGLRVTFPGKVRHPQRSEAPPQGPRFGLGGVVFPRPRTPCRAQSVLSKHTERVRESVY